MPVTSVAKTDQTNSPRLNAKSSCLVNSGWADDVIRAGIKPPQRDLIEGVFHGSLTHDQFGAVHPGGIVAGMSDGSVRIFTYEMDPTTFRWVTVRNDANIIKKL